MKINEIDELCKELGYTGKNATQAIADKDDDALWSLAEFLGLDDWKLVNDVYNFLKGEIK